MKKRILAILICSSVLCGLCACGNKEENIKLSKEEMLVNATTVNADELLNEIGGNKAKAQSYVGSTYCITGHVLEIENDYCLVLGADTGDWNNVVHSDDWQGYAELVMFKVYLPTEELAKLDKCENIQFVGEITNTETFTYAKIEPLGIEVSNAYLVKENVKYEGKDRLEDYKK